MSGANFSEKFNFPSVSNQPCPEKSPEHAASHRIRIRRGGRGRRMGKCSEKLIVDSQVFAFLRLSLQKQAAAPAFSFAIVVVVVVVRD